MAALLHRMGFRQLIDCAFELSPVSVYPAGYMLERVPEALPSWQARRSPEVGAQATRVARCTQQSQSGDNPRASQTNHTFRFRVQEDDVSTQNLSPTPNNC